MPKLIKSLSTAVERFAVCWVLGSSHEYEWFNICCLITSLTNVAKYGEKMTKVRPIRGPYLKELAQGC